MKEDTSFPLMMSNWLAREITYLGESFNLRYVLLVESLSNDEC